MSSERVLVWLKYRFIGDAVLTTPLLHALAARYERPDVLTAPHLRVLLSGEGGLDFVENNQDRGLRAFMQQVRTVRHAKYDLAVVVNRSFRSALVAKLAGIPRRIGFPTERRGFLLTDRVPYLVDGFEGECYARLGDPLGLKVQAQPPRLTMSTAELEAGAKLKEGARVGLVPGCTVTERGIPSGKAAEIAHELGEKVLLIGAANERSFVEPLLPLLKVPCVDLVGSCTLRESMAAIAGLDVLIGPDSGLIHIAAGLGVPTITTFAFSPAEKWGHKYAPHTVLKTPDQTMVSMNVPAVVAAARVHLS